MNTLLLGAVLSRREQWYDGDGPMPDAVDRRAWRASSRSGAGSCASRSTATRRSSTTASRRSSARSSAIEGAEVWGAKHAPEDIPSLEHPAERIQGGVPSLDWNAMTGLVRRRGGRPHRLLADRAADRPRCDRAARPAARHGPATPGSTTSPACCRSTRAASRTSRWSSSTPRTRPRCAPPTTSRARSSARPASSATASTGRTCASWTSPPSSTRSTTTPTGASARRSRTRVDPTASSRPASRASGRARCETRR